LLFLTLLLLAGATQISWAQTRSLKLYYIHTNERADIVFKKDGRYVASGLKKLNHFLRDWRRNEPTDMDPLLFDLVWEIYQESGARDYIHVVSAYRAPSTNNMLRLKSASSGVAKDSQHTLGKAMDFYIPDVKLEKLRQISLKKEGGGVGYYPKSNAPFVHVDVGNVRHWPRMNRQELMALFPNGKTIHVPSDGQPLSGYQQALLAHQARKNKQAPIQIAQNEPAKPEKKTLFSALFGKKKATEPTVPEIAVAYAETKTDNAPIALPDDDVPLPLASPLRKEDDGVMENGQMPVAVAMRDDEQTAFDDTAPQPSSKPILARGGEPEGEIVPRPAQLAYLPSAAINQDRDGAAALLEDIPTLIARGEDVEIIPLPDEDLIDEDRPAPTTYTMNHNNHGEVLIRHDAQHEADRDVIRQAIIEAIAALEAADQQTVASISFNPAEQTAAMPTEKTAEAIAISEELRQIPDMVFVSKLQKKQPAPQATLTGRAITFPSIARIFHDE